MILDDQVFFVTPWYYWVL